MLFGPINFLLRQEPQCPYCRDTLLPEATAFIRGTAFCQSCHDIITDDILNKILATRTDPSVYHGWIESRGLSWFVAPPQFPRRMAAHLLRDRNRGLPL